MYDERKILTFGYQDAYGNVQEYKTVDVTGMTESQVNATKARIMGQMSDYLSTGDEMDSVPIPNSEPMPDYMILAKTEEENLRLQSQIKQLMEENYDLKVKNSILKEMLVESYGN